MSDSNKTLKKETRNWRQKAEKNQTKDLSKKGANANEFGFHFTDEHDGLEILI